MHFCLQVEKETCEWGPLATWEGIRALDPITPLQSHQTTSITVHTWADFYDLGGKPDLNKATPSLPVLHIPDLSWEKICKLNYWIIPEMLGGRREASGVSVWLYKLSRAWLAGSRDPKPRPTSGAVELSSVQPLTLDRTFCSFCARVFLCIGSLLNFLVLLLYFRL